MDEYEIFRNFENGFKEDDSELTVERSPYNPTQTCFSAIISGSGHETLIEWDTPSASAESKILTSKPFMQICLGRVSLCGLMTF